MATITVALVDENNATPQVRPLPPPHSSNPAYFLYHTAITSHPQGIYLLAANLPSIVGMPYQHSTLTYRGPPKRTYEEGPGGQVGQSNQPYSNRRFQASHPTAFAPYPTTFAPRPTVAPHPTTFIDHSRGSGSSINSTISNNKAGWWKWKRGSNNEANISSTTNKNKSLSPPQGEAHREQKWKRGNDINNTSPNTSKNNSLPLPQAKEHEEPTKKDHNLPSPQAPGQKEQTAFQKPTEGKEEKLKINQGSDVTMNDSPSAQVPAFYHLLLLESLSAPGSELKDEYVRERRRLTKLYGLQLNQSEDEVAMEYMENRTKGIEAEAARREQMSENNGRGRRRQG